MNDLEVEIDVGLCNDTMPPIVVPLSDRAKEKMDLPEGALGALFIDNSAQEFLAVFPSDWICGNIELEYGDKDLIVLMSIKVLH